MTIEEPVSALRVNDFRVHDKKLFNHISSRSKASSPKKGTSRLFCLTNVEIPLGLMSGQPSLDLWTLHLSLPTRRG